jgi:hypothetical protein
MRRRFPGGRVPLGQALFATSNVEPVDDPGIIRVAGEQVG